MKHLRTAAVIVMLVLLTVVGSYWLLMRKDYISALPSDADDPFGDSEVQATVKEAFEPIRELDLHITYDRPLKQFLFGEWRCHEPPYIEKFFYEPPDGSDGSTDFVEIEPDGSCRFRLHEFEYEGGVTYDRAYAGYFVEFPHGDKTHIFIFSPDDQTWEEEPPKRLAVAFVGHDPKPRYREIDYQGLFARRSPSAEPADHGNEGEQE